MKGKIAYLFVAALTSSAYGAGVSALDTALQQTYYACVDIDENLHDLKVLAGVNTAVTAIGTGLGTGALASGLSKAKIDQDIETLKTNIHVFANDYQGPSPTEDQKQAWQRQVADLLNTIDPTTLDPTNVEMVENVQNELEKRSKKMGNWRTGLLAVNTATNIAGAVIASKTISNNDIPAQVAACIAATKNLEHEIMAAKIQGTDVLEAQQIYNSCSEYEYVDISPIFKRGKGAMISASVGAGLGGVGTVVSGIANDKDIRADDSEDGQNKEKQLNTAANVLVAGATVSSAAATVFNATQVSAIKKLATVSQKCTEVLK